MKRLLKYLRESLTARLSLWLVFFASLVFLITMGFMFSQSRKTVRDEALRGAERELSNTVLRVQSILERVEIAANNTYWLVSRHLNTPDSMFVYSKNILVNNPELNGCSIAFEPYYYEEYGRYFSAFSYNDNGTVLTTQEGNPNYEYFTMDWYLLPKLLDRATWTEPFADFNPEDIYSKDMIASYCRPIYNGEGQYIGTLSVDLSLAWLSETISSVKPYPNSYSIMTGLGGTYFVHPDSTKLFYQSIYTETLKYPDPQRTALGKAMQNCEEGYLPLTINGEECYVFYKPLGDTGWSAAIVCPLSDIFSGLKRMQRIILIIFLLGLLLMLLTSRRIISRELNPLSQLTSQIETISSGQLDQELPDNGRVDELGRLYQSFSGMQHSLIEYIDKMQQTAAASAAIEKELKVASDIQMSMVPRIFPAFPNRNDIDLFASMTPAKEVGGDLYDFFVQGDKMYFCVGDVSGKGVPASLFMAVTRNLFRIIAQQGHDPVSIAMSINEFLSQDNNQNMFVTMFIGLIDLNTSHLDFCNCGHNPPVMVRRGEKAQFLPIKHFNQPLGIIDGIPFQGDSMDDIRDVLFLIYTDGLNEAENPRFEQFGDDAVLDILSKVGSESAEQVITSLKDAVETHREGISPNDDLTLMCFRLLKM
jgi:sigma-B regulation protein RsbU (phosphoserine phosphatase)